MCRSLASQLNPAALATWQQTVRALRTSVAAWLSKASKHVMVAYPLLTQLLCLEPDDAFLHGVGPLLEGLHKQLRVRSRRRSIKNADSGQS